MKVIEKTGKNIEEIIDDFKTEFKLEDYDFTYEVVQKPEKAFLGFIGGKQAKIKFTINNIKHGLEEYLKEFAVYAHLSYNTISVKSDDKYFYVEINGVEDPGVFIGKDGKFLMSLQYILTQTFTTRDPQKRGVVVDIEGYKERQEKNLTKKVLHLANQAIKTKKNITLEHMNAAERRVVHKAVKDMKEIKTMTIGEGTIKRVVICPAKGKTT